ncbi:MAG: hypothetical protein M1820_010336 [Bogoriella megaspora]|nr:MAG: hypothetical protein M1820_010336 [Bogoriella megaspora]
MAPPTSNPALPPSQPAARHPPTPPYKVLEESEKQWLFTEEELKRTPSVADGMLPETERELRGKGINFILQVGIMLKLPQLTLSTAAVFFNRFLMRLSLVDKGGRKALHQYQIAATAVFLATKVEENCRKVKELVIACCRVAQKNPNLVVDEQSKDYWRWKDTILLNEDILLELLCFDLTIEGPHKIFYEYLKHHGIEHHRELRNAGWAFLNDAILTQLCLLFNSRTIAAAALYCAARFCSCELPNGPKDASWWEMHHVRLKDIKRACNYMVDCYENTPLRPGMEAIYVSLRSPISLDDPTAEGGGLDEERTRLRISSQTPNTPALAGPLGSSSMERSVSAESATSLKRRREVEDAGMLGPSNGDAPPPPPEKRIKVEIPERVREEEATRVQNGNSKNKNGKLDDDDNVSEEGELEE